MIWLFFYIIFLLVTITCAVDENAMTIPLKIGKNEYSLSFSATIFGAINMANRFCTEKGNVFNIDVNLFDLEEDCIVPISKYLQDKVKLRLNQIANLKSSQSKDLIIDLEISKNHYKIRINPEIDETQIIATEFCNENLVELGISFDNLRDSCVNQINEHLENVVIKYNSEINDDNYKIEITHPTIVNSKGQVVREIDSLSEKKKAWLLNRNRKD